MTRNATKVIAGWAVSATITLAILTLVFVLPYIENLRIKSKLLTSFALILGSAALYRTISTIFWSFFNRVLFFRRLALGRFFVEGTWIGHYIRNGNHVVTVEFYDQKDGELRIVGAEVDADSRTISQWSSYAASLDYLGESVVYAYSCNVFGRSGAHEGIARFSLVRNGKTRASELDGYAADLPDGVKDANYEYKVSDQQVDRAYALAEAKRKYKF